MQLEKELHTRVREICADGYALFDQHQYSRAIRRFFQAWVLIPKPQNNYVEAGWVLTALGDAYYKNGQFLQSLEALKSALCCIDLEDNPFILLRLGQSAFELGERKSAKAFFQRCLSAGGNNLLAQEDSKYQTLLNLSR